tara:strand:+ start:2997 stop:3146 length:150 start_codon:yes stop_codon:yes gene_type:complete
MIYKEYEAAVVGAKEFANAIETVVPITKDPKGYVLFGQGELVIEVTPDD